MCLGVLPQLLSAELLWRVKDRGDLHLVVLVGHRLGFQILPHGIDLLKLVTDLGIEGVIVEDLQGEGSADVETSVQEILYFSR